ncbi:MAG: peptide deformylase [Bacteroidales bacterium]|nr:peptide deformylase [Bacteroidales bacterium]
MMTLSCNGKDNWTDAERELIGSQGDVMHVTKTDNEADLAILRSISRDLPVEAVMDPIFPVLAEKMTKTMLAPENDGVGIAGPQVGLLRRVIVVQRLDKAGEPCEVYPNIRITRFGGKMEAGQEGCLSVPARRGRVLRDRDIDITYTNPASGKDTTEHVEGFTAVIFQHEIDHLDGILYIDKTYNDDPALFDAEAVKGQIENLCRFIPDHGLSDRAEYYLTPSYYDLYKRCFDLPKNPDDLGDGEFLYYFVSGNGGGTPVFAMEDITFIDNENAEARISVAEDFSEYGGGIGESRTGILKLVLQDGFWKIDDWDGTRTLCEEYLKSKGITES